MMKKIITIITIIIVCVVLLVVRHSNSNFERFKDYENDSSYYEDKKNFLLQSIEFYEDRNEHEVVRKLSEELFELEGMKNEI